MTRHFAPGSEIRIELLRPGDLNGQLLSRLTPYIAVTAERHIETLQLPFDHLQLVRAHSGLGGAVQPDQRRSSLDELGLRVAQILSRISQLPGLLTGRSHELVHLRLTLAGHELAMVPWEASQLPSGAGAAAQKLLLQAANPVVLTRELRESAQRRFDWSRAPRVLLAVAGPLLPTAVLRAHVLAFYRALHPFQRQQQHPDSAGRGIEEMLQILPAASLGDIYQACRDAKPAFTHIVIVAHGRLYFELGQPCYGVELCHPHSGREIVAGDRLLTAMQLGSDRIDPERCPLFAALLVCHSDSVGNVLLPFGGLAHQLHSGGIPWVLGSQFPLSMNGSVRLCETFFPALFAGSDPRNILFQVRQELHAMQPNHPDWASLTVYASFPPDFDEQLLRSRRLRLHEAMSVLFNQIDPQPPPSAASPARSGTHMDEPVGSSGYDRIRQQLDQRVPEFDQLVADCAATNKPDVYADGLSIRGSLYRNSAFLRLKQSGDPDARQFFVDQLRMGEQDYLQAAKIYPKDTWNAVHALAISWFLRDPLNQLLWAVSYLYAWHQIEEEPNSGWGYVAAIELIIIAKLYRDRKLNYIIKNNHKDRNRNKNWEKIADWHIKQVQRTNSSNKNIARRLVRQLGRYAEDPKLNNRAVKQFIVSALAKFTPRTESKRW